MKITAIILLIISIGYISFELYWINRDEKREKEFKKRNNES
jgi:hypothetical protein|tara:strand:- start:2320 stop:2442 length:123 start_codon:yes stop_codon:yes gene_type:complete